LERYPHDDNRLQVCHEVGLLGRILDGDRDHAGRSRANGTNGAVVVTNGPQIDPGDRSGSWSAQQNVRDSERYEAVVQANSSFRANRINKECGPINDPQLHTSCVASFGQ
jgi:hypothetical protein